MYLVKVNVILGEWLYMSPWTSINYYYYETKKWDCDIHASLQRNERKGEGEMLSDAKAA